MKIKKLFSFIFIIAAVFCFGAITAFASGNETTVKLEWEISDITFTYKSNKTWNPEALTWEESKSDIQINSADATFTLTNNSSKAIIATAAFEPSAAVTATYGGTTFNNNGCKISKAGTGTITATINFNSEELPNLNITTDVAAKYGTYTVTISEAPKQDEDCCFAKGTKITMGDGTTKNIEDIVVGDSVLTYNHEAGKYEAQDVSLVFKGETLAKPFTLYFDNGTKVSVTHSHPLFEKESLKYVLISKDNAESLIGNHYFSANENGYIELVSVSFEEEPVEFYTLYTEYSLNYFAEGLLNISDDIVAYLNFYTFNEDLSVDMDILEQDVETYGLMVYSEDLGIGTTYDFEIWNCKYGNIILGKGLITWDDVEALAKEYKEMNHE